MVDPEPGDPMGLRVVSAVQFFGMPGTELWMGDIGKERCSRRLLGGGTGRGDPMEPGGWGRGGGALEADAEPDLVSPTDPPPAVEGN